MRIAIIAAAAENDTIGASGRLPWHLPDEMANFRRQTLGHPVIVGRTTWESLPGRRLPGRHLIVVTRDPGALASRLPEDGRTAGSLAHALACGRELAALSGVSRVWIAGGARIYRDALAHAHEIQLSRIHAHVPGDSFFPPIDEQVWDLSERSPHTEPGARPDWTLMVYRRRGVALAPLSDAPAPCAAADT